MKHRVRLAVLAVCAAMVLPSPSPAQHHHQAGQDHHQHSFDEPERYAQAFDDPSRDAWQMPDRVIGALSLEPTERVADIGAGTGYFSVRLAAAVPDGTVYAVDIEPAMLEHTRERAAASGISNLRPILAGSDSPNLPEPVDAILIVNTYHHLPNRPTYFRDLASRLTPRGRIAIVDYRKDSPEGPPVEFRFEPEHIAAEMQQAGYVLDARHDYLPRQHFLVFRPAGGR